MGLKIDVYDEPINFIMKQPYIYLLSLEKELFSWGFQIQKYHILYNSSIPIFIL